MNDLLCIEVLEIEDDLMRVAGKVKMWAWLKFPESQIRDGKPTEDSK